MNDQQRSRIIRMAWEDRCSFDEIKERTGFTEAEVIKLMRSEMKPSSFRMWRKRVTGRVTKHQARINQLKSDLKRGPVTIPETGDEVGGLEEQTS